MPALALFKTYTHFLAINLKRCFNKWFRLCPPHANSWCSAIFRQEAKLLTLTKDQEYILVHTHSFVRAKVPHPYFGLFLDGMWRIANTPSRCSDYRDGHELFACFPLLLHSCTPGLLSYLAGGRVIEPPPTPQGAARSMDSQEGRGVVGVSWPKWERCWIAACVSRAVWLITCELGI